MKSLSISKAMHMDESFDFQDRGLELEYSF